MTIVVTAHCCWLMVGYFFFHCSVQEAYMNIKNFFFGPICNVLVYNIFMHMINRTSSECACRYTIHVQGVYKYNVI